MTDLRLLRERKHLRHFARQFRGALVPYDRPRLIGVERGIELVGQP